MLTIPNLLSFLRIPLAFLFLQGNLYLRLLALLSAAFSDFLDGFLARRYQMSSRIGTTLDPMSDKFFVMFVLSVLFFEEKLTFLEAICMLCRDFAVIFFGLYLILAREWDHYQFRAIWCGKVTTACQFAVLVTLTLDYKIPSSFYSIFIFLGALALIELYLFRTQETP